MAEAVTHRATRQLLQAIEDFLNETPKGTPPQVVKGLRSLSAGLRGGGPRGESPGAREARELSKYPKPDQLEPDEEFDPTASPGEREALAVARGER